MIVVVVTLLFFAFFNPKQDIAYVDNVELFNGFNMSKDLGQANNFKLKAQKKKLDSLYNIYSIFREQGDNEKTKALELQLRSEDQELKRMNEYLSKDLSEKVWSRLNQYVKEYGESKRYKVVLGTQGYGNVMYAKDGIDITADMLIYSNEKYEGH